MTGLRRNFFRSWFTFALFLTSFWLGALRPAAAQGRGSGGGGGGAGGGQTGWIERFDSIPGMLANGWGIEQTGSPDSLFGVPGTGLASKSFDAKNVAIGADGILRLKLSISNALQSSGALVYTQQIYGYGTYEWCARMSSTATSADPTSPAYAGLPLSGGISAGFVYVNNSQTEIDFEQARSGSLDWFLYMANWANLRPKSSAVKATAMPGNVPTYSEFKVYKFDWKKDYIEFFVDGTSLAFHTTNVPRTAAHVMVNHWGTNNPTGFGGPAQAGERYFYVDWVRYTPLLAIPVGGIVPCGPA